MIRVVHQGNRSHFNELMDRQFRLRHEVFVKERGWTGLEVDGAYEKDQYDNESATYLIAADDRGAVAGGFRLYPTTLPHMLTEQFPTLVEGSIPRRTDMLELTRFAMRKTERRSRHYFELLVAIQEYGLAEGLAGYTSVISPLRLPILQGFGFEIEPLGLPQSIDGDAAMAVFFTVSEAGLARVRKAANIDLSVLDETVLQRRRA